MGMLVSSRTLEEVQLLQPSLKMIYVGNLQAIAGLGRGGNMELRDMVGNATDRGEILPAPDPYALPSLFGNK